MRYVANVVAFCVIIVCGAHDATANPWSFLGGSESSDEAEQVSPTKAKTEAEIKEAPPQLGSGPSITMVERAAFGKAVFVVLPNQVCEASHDHGGEQRPLDCSSAYVVVCDAENPNAPLCVIR